MCRLCELKCKEVINICDGARLGFIFDIDMDPESGKIFSFIVKGRALFGWPFSRCEEYIVPLCNIEKIGEDIILVKLENCCTRRRRRFL